MAQFLDQFVGKPADTRIVEVGGDRAALFALEDSDVGILPSDVGGVACIDFELAGDPGGEGAEFGPDRTKTGEIDAGKCQQIERRAALAVAVDFQAMGGGLGWG